MVASNVLPDVMPMRHLQDHAGLTLQNYGEEVATVSGAALLDGPKWERHDLPTAASGGNAYVADIAAAQLNEVPGFQVNGMRVTRARFPNGVWTSMVNYDHVLVPSAFYATSCARWRVFFWATVLATC